MQAESIKQTYTYPISEFDTVQNAIIELVKEGVIILSRSLQPIHSNRKAKEICQQLWSNHYPSDKFPPVISELLYWLRKNFGSGREIFVMDYQLDEERIIRIRACPISSDHESKITSVDRPWLLLFLEDRNAVFQDELQIEQKKYKLTNRELEVLSLLSQSFSYQEIANRLQVSINTVKAHVKKINSKKQNCLNQKIIFKIDKQ